MPQVVANRRSCGGAPLNTTPISPWVPTRTTLTLTQGVRKGFDNRRATDSVTSGMVAQRRRAPLSLVLTIVPVCLSRRRREVHSRSISLLRVRCRGEVLRSGYSDSRRSINRSFVVMMGRSLASSDPARKASWSWALNRCLCTPDPDRCPLTRKRECRPTSSSRSPRSESSGSERSGCLRLDEARQS
jgi:hypothetical protein